MDYFEMESELDSKPWWRWRNILIALTLAIICVAVWMAYEAARVNSAKPALTVDYAQRLQAMTAANQPAGEKAWPQLIEAATLTDEAIREVTAMQLNLVDEFDGGEPDLARLTTYDFMPPPTERELAVLRLMSERGVFDVLDRAAAMPRAVMPLSAVDTTIAAAGPDMHRIRHLAKISAARMRLAFAEHDIDHGIQSFQHIMAMGRAMSCQPTILRWLVGCSCHWIGLDAMESTVRDHQFDEATCRRLLDAVRTAPRPAQVIHGLESERLILLSTIQQLCSDDGDGRGYLLPHEMLKLTSTSRGVNKANIGSAFVARFFWPNRLAITAAVNAWFDAHAILAHLPPAQQATWTFDEAAFHKEYNPRKAMIIEVLLPDLRRLINNDPWLSVNHEGTIACLQLALHRARHGDLPASLDAIDSDLTGPLSSDPLHSGPWGYRLLDDDPHGRPFLLYSTGRDTIDNGGYDGNDRSITIDPGAAGLDYLITHPREPLPMPDIE